MSVVDTTFERNRRTNFHSIDSLRILVDYNWATVAVNIRDE